MNSCPSKKGCLQYVSSSTISEAMPEAADVINSACIGQKPIATSLLVIQDLLLNYLFSTSFTPLQTALCEVVLHRRSYI